MNEIEKSDCAKFFVADFYSERTYQFFKLSQLKVLNEKIWVKIHYLKCKAESFV